MWEDVFERRGPYVMTMDRRKELKISNDRSRRCSVCGKNLLAGDQYFLRKFIRGDRVVSRYHVECNLP